MPKTYHILNGDALLDFFPDDILGGEIIVARECLVDGPVQASTLSKFWQIRAAFIHEEYGEDKESYFTDVVTEFDKIGSIPAGSEVNLWFEEDLFCQVNLWFCISLLTEIAKESTIRIVKPLLNDDFPDWRGFGSLDRSALAEAYQNRQTLSTDDIQLLSNLWLAYCDGDKPRLARLADIKTPRFPFLKEVVQAQLERSSDDNLSGRPERALRDIIREKKTDDFKIIFKEFTHRQGIYGFGDWQVERLLGKISD